MSAKPTAPVYGYDQPPPPQYDSVPKHPHQQQPPQGAQGNYGAVPVPSYTHAVSQPQPAETTRVIIVGGCPACRVGVLEDDYTALGVICAVLFFPIGLICCLAMKQRRCSNCGAIFG